MIKGKEKELCYLIRTRDGHPGAKWPVSASREQGKASGSVWLTGTGLRDLLLDTIAELDLSYYAVSQYLDQGEGERSLLHAQLLDERAGSVIRRYEYAVARLLEQEMAGVTSNQQPRIREVVKPIYLAPPARTSWLHRLLFGG